MENKRGEVGILPIILIGIMTMLFIITIVIVVWRISSDKKMNSDLSAEKTTQQRKWTTENTDAEENTIIEEGTTYEEKTMTEGDVSDKEKFKKQWNNAQNLDEYNSAKDFYENSLRNSVAREDILNSQEIRECIVYSCYQKLPQNQEETKEYLSAIFYDMKDIDLEASLDWEKPNDIKKNMPILILDTTIFYCNKEKEYDTYKIQYDGVLLQQVNDLIQEDDRVSVEGFDPQNLNKYTEKIDDETAEKNTVDHYFDENEENEKHIDENNDEQVY